METQVGCQVEHDGDGSGSASGTGSNDLCSYK